MTHSSHRFTTLSADDVALCRAHSEAIDDARESRALQRWIDAVAPLVTPVMSVRAFEVGNHMPADLPMPPSYWDDLEHWLKTLAPAKPAAEQTAKSQDASGWRLGSDVPLHERVGLWHFRLGDGKYRGAGSRAVDAAAFNAHEWAEGHWQFRVAASGTKVGDPYDESKYTAADLTARLASTSIAADGAALIGAKPAAPAQQPAQKASTHIVCVKSYVSQASISFHVGQVVGITMADVLRAGKSEYWLPCDESGWVTHVPTADAVCPVPAGVGCQLRLRDRLVLADVSDEPTFRSRGYWREDGGETITHWRPIAQS